MAGDWIAVEKATARKPEVLRVADILGIHPDHAFGLCVRFWFWCDDQLENGHAPSVTIVTLDSVISHAGFCSAMVEVGWLVVKNDSLVIPNFDRHLSKNAKSRLLTARRQKNKRSRAKRDGSVTTEQNSIPPNPQKFGGFNSNRRTRDRWPPMTSRDTESVNSWIRSIKTIPRDQTTVSKIHDAANRITDMDELFFEIERIAKGAA